MIRPILVGLNNPHSTDPRAALLPRPIGSAGHRLFKMSRLDWSDYNAVFERVNVVDIEYPAISLRDRRVVVFGREAWMYLDLDPIDPMQYTFRWGSRVTFAPHPSGRNHFYNDPRNRERLRVVLREIKKSYRKELRDAQDRA